MLPTNERGEYITIKNVFHSLNTRLDELMNGINDLISIERNINLTEITFAIDKYNNGFSESEFISEIDYSLGLIEIIQASIENIDRNLITSSWINYEDILNEISKELIYYKSVLEKLNNKLVLHRNATEEKIMSATNKIPINISVPQFSLLLYLLSIEDNKTKIKPVFNTELTTLVSEVIKICSHPNGKPISPNALYNKRTSELYKAKVLEFWRDRFNSYEAWCKNILSEIESDLSN